MQISPKAKLKPIPFETNYRPREEEAEGDDVFTRKLSAEPTSEFAQ